MWLLGAWPRLGLTKALSKPLLEKNRLCWIVPLVPPEAHGLAPALRSAT